MTLTHGTVFGFLNFVVSAIMFCISSSTVGVPANSHETPDPREAMINALSALGPHASLGDEARVFDRFVGTWDCDYTFFLADGSTKHSVGEIKFGWILDGQAVQDIWITYPKEAGKERGIGTTVRFFDTKLKTWRIIFVSPSPAALIAVQGGTEADRIVLRGIDDEGTMLRWSFNDIKPDSFNWRGETSRDGGKTWKLEEHHYMRRRTGNSAQTASLKGKAANDPRTDMIRTLQSSRPSPSLGNQAQIFDRFVGTWDLDCVLYGPKGEVTRYPGQWVFGWALDGKLEQDVILQGSERVARGTTLRFYDARSGKWRIVWIPPGSGNVAILKGGAVGDRIVLEGVDGDGSPFRWSFNDIRRDSFLWRGEISSDGGKTWRLEQEMHLKRHDPKG
jgi:hypothetical protein